MSQTHPSNPTFISQITIDERDPVSLDAALDEIAFYSSALPPSLIRLHYDETLNHTHGTKGTPYVMANTPPHPFYLIATPFLCMWPTVEGGPLLRG